MPWIHEPAQLYGHWVRVEAYAVRGWAGAGCLRSSASVQQPATLFRLTMHTHNHTNTYTHNSHLSLKVVPLAEKVVDALAFMCDPQVVGGRGEEDGGCGFRNGGDICAHVCMSVCAHVCVGAPMPHAYLKVHVQFDQHTQPRTHAHAHVQMMYLAAQSGLWHIFLSHSYHARI